MHCAIKTCRTHLQHLPIIFQSFFIVLHSNATISHDFIQFLLGDAIAVLYIKQLFFSITNRNSCNMTDTNIWPSPVKLKISVLIGKKKKLLQSSPQSIISISYHRQINSVTRTITLLDFFQCNQHTCVLTKFQVLLYRLPVRFYGSVQFVCMVQCFFRSMKVWQAEQNLCTTFNTCKLSVIICSVEMIITTLVNS